MSQPHPVIKLITVMCILDDSELVIILNIYTSLNIVLA